MATKTVYRKHQWKDLGDNRKCDHCGFEQKKVSTPDNNGRVNTRWTPDARPCKKGKVDATPN